MGKGEGEGGGGGGGERRRKRKHHRHHHHSSSHHGTKRRHKHRRHRRDDERRSSHAGRETDQGRRSPSRSPSHSSGFGSDQDQGSVQIEELREAVRSQVGEILAGHPEMETFLVKIVEHLGKGKKVDVQSVENPSLKSKLVHLFLLFRSSHNVSASKDNQVFQVSGGSGRQEAGVGVFDLVTASIEDHLKGKAKGGEKEKEADAQQLQMEEPPKTPKEAKGKRTIGPTMPIGPAPPPQTIGPQLPPSSDYAGGDARGRGPSASVSEQLLEELHEDDFVGPVQVVAGGAALKSAAEEIDRILKCALGGGNSYQILGVDPTVITKDVVKRYLKLSLLIHPDKCKVPKAQDAFAILNKAKEELRDKSKRMKLDDKLDDEKLWDLAVSEAKRMQQVADWQSIRNTGHVSKEKGPLQREEWMTTPGTGPSRPQIPSKNVTRFSR